MEAWILEVMERLSYVGVFLLIAVENLFPPIPSELILTFGGFLTTMTPLSAPMVIVWATAGSLLGAVLLYGLGRLFERSRIEKIVRAYGKILCVKVTDIHRAFAWFEKYQSKTVFFCRMVPILRSLISIPAGMAKMKLGPFLLLTTLGSLIWNSLLVFAGAFLGEKREAILHYMDIYSLVVYILLGVAAAAVIGYFLYRRKHYNGQE